MTGIGNYRNLKGHYFLTIMPFLDCDTPWYTNYSFARIGLCIHVETSECTHLFFDILTFPYKITDKIPGKPYRINTKRQRHIIILINTHITHIHTGIYFTIETQTKKIA